MNKILDVGTVVAFVTQEHSWVLGKVAAYDVRTKQYTCSSTDPAPMTIDRIKADPDSIWAPRVDCLEEDVNDLLQLTELHEASLLFSLKRRYMRDVVYTNIGPIVVALNPFNYNIPWYTGDAMKKYLCEGVQIEHNLPHSWAVAHNTYWELRENALNQTILISGESGAGKTEAAKIVVRYLGALSTRNGTQEQQQVCEQVNKRVNAASPILEAFGNAKTVRNDNSSRFGKFAKIQFDRDGFLVGSFATKYLLEKSRIITAAKDERVYHAFYQLAVSEDAKHYHIRNPKLHRTLTSGACTVVEGIDDAVEYVATSQAMSDIGMSADEKAAIWHIVAGILFFQNVEFVEVEERSGRVASIDPSLQQVLARTCELWGLQHEDLHRELLTTTMVSRGETTIKPLSKSQATDTRDSVSKSLYDWLFNWLVEKINTTTDASASCFRWIGLLDIFGFENFTTNSFEQLCINLANETLQQHYNQHIFTEDMRECREEGIDTADVHFVDNHQCLDLLASKQGIFTMLDDECMVNGTEKNFLQKLTALYSGSKSKPGHPFFGQTTGRAMDNCFRVKHYAAEVQYVVDSFMDKNRDTLKDAMKQVLGASTNSLIRHLAPAVDENSKGSQKASVGTYFRAQLKELMELINSTNPHWIRCIKPHPAKQPRMFSHQDVMVQLRSAGVLDTVKVRKAGYPIRFKIDLFVVRYRILIPKEVSGRSPSEISRAILDTLGITNAIGQLGKTKVFLRQEAFTKLNHAKDGAIEVFARLIQAACRASVERAALFRVYVVQHRAKIMEERKKREEALRRQREEEARRRKAEEEERLRQERLLADRRLRAVIRLQKLVRGFLSRSRIARFFLEQFRAREERRIDDGFSRWRSGFEDLCRKVFAVEKRKWEAETSKVMATQHSHLNKRRALVEVREARMRDIAANAQYRQQAIEREIRNDLDRTRRTQRQELKRDARQFFDSGDAARSAADRRREDAEARHARELNEMLDSGRYPKPGQATTIARAPVAGQRAASPVRAGSPRSSPRFNQLKSSFQREEEWLAQRLQQRAPIAAHADPFDELGALERSFRDRVLTEAHTRAEVARLVSNRDSGRPL